MPTGVLTNIKISGIASAAPDNLEDLSGFNEYFGENSVKSFSKMTGVKTRYVSHENQTSSDLCFVASKNLLKHLKWEKESIDALIFVTQTPDYPIPATACVLHKRLGLSRDCIAFDVNLGCSGYVYGIHLVASLMQNTSIKRALLLAGDTSNKKISPFDKSSAMLFGDSGSATAMERTDSDLDRIEFLMKTDGNGFKSIIIPSGAFRNPNGKHERYEFAEGIIRSDYELYMNGVEVLNFTISDVVDTINEFKEKFKTNTDRVDMFVLHQANLFMLKAMAKKAKIPLDRMPISLDRYGNTSVTSIPLTICDACERIEEKKELNLVCAGFGVGLSWGVISMKVDSDNCLSIIRSNDYYDDGELNKP